MQAPEQVPAAVLDAWSLAGGQLQAITQGHINRTWRVEHPRGTFALQWLNPIFAPEVNLDIEALTAHLHAQGLVTPRLVPTEKKGLYFDDPNSGFWRVLTWIEGTVLAVAHEPERCHAAGVLLGQVHAALWQHEHRFAFRRPGVHDTARHLAAMKAALAKHPDHPAQDQVAELAQEIVRSCARWDVESPLPLRLVHGDPKISNIVFDARGQGLCLIDLDTFNYMPIAVELGDAFRSWCSPAGEESKASFDLEHFSQGLQGYASVMRELPDEEEWRAIPSWTEIICLELAARFACDALMESYFNWDRQRYKRASEHNLVRARSQLALARSIDRQIKQMMTINTEVWTAKQ